MYLTYSSDLTWRVEWLQHCPVWCGVLKWQGPISVMESQTAAAVKDCMRYHITQTTVDVILYPYPNTSQLMFVKGPLQANKIRIYTIADHKCLAYIQNVTKVPSIKITKMIIPSTYHTHASLCLKISNTFESSAHAAMCVWSQCGYQALHISAYTYLVWSLNPR